MLAGGPTFFSIWPLGGTEGFRFFLDISFILKTRIFLYLTSMPPGISPPPFGGQPPKRKLFADHITFLYIILFMKFSTAVYLACPQKLWEKNLVKSRNRDFLIKGRYRFFLSPSISHTVLKP